MINNASLIKSDKIFSRLSVCICFENMHVPPFENRVWNTSFCMMAILDLGL